MKFGRTIAVLSTLFAIMPLSFADSAKPPVVASIKASAFQSLINPKTANYTWLGGDVGSSIKLAPNHYIWLFGDTIVGRSIDEKGGRLSRHADEKVFIHNSIGSTYQKNGKWQPIVKTYGHDAAGKPANCLDSGVIGTFLWPLNGVMLKHKLLILTTEVPDKGLVIGTTYVLVDNPQASPSNWIYHVYRILPSSSNEQLFTGVVREGNTLYLFGYRGKDGAYAKGAQAIIARINVNQAEQGKWQAIRYWDGGDHWGAKPTKARAIKGMAPSTEASFNYRKDLGWYTFQIPGSFDVHFYHAKKLTGPWKDEGVVYSVPAIWQQLIPKTNVNLFDAYAVKDHPEMGNNNDFVFTYNLNIGYGYPGDGLKKLFQLIPDVKYSALYIPQFVVCHFNNGKILLNVTCSSH